jgi:ABC-type Fe3+/spermidine/putrescine transport system ATPase subunit
MSKLRVEDVSKKYGSYQALNHVNLAVEPGEFLAIMGPSGCGKTTLLLAILGVLKIDEGHIYIDEEVVDIKPVDERRIGYVPQDYGLFPHLTVHANIAFGLKAMKQERSMIDAKVKELLSLVDLTGLEGRKPSELSGGQKQRVALARALAIQPQLLLLDEPLSSIDEITKAEVRKNLRETIKKRDVTTVCVMHNPADSIELGDKIAVMYAGKIVQSGRPNDLLENPASELVTKLITTGYDNHRSR